MERKAPRRHGGFTMSLEKGGGKEKEEDRCRRRSREKKKKE